jgi:tetratricopeptide (TPR) repeat protein
MPIHPKIFSFALALLPGVAIAAPEAALDEITITATKVATPLLEVQRRGDRSIHASGAQRLRQSETRVLSMSPADDVSAWCALGVALASLGDRTGALVALRHALSRDATHVPSRLALGKLLFDCGKVEHALQCFDCAREDAVT